MSQCWTGHIWVGLQCYLGNNEVSVIERGIVEVDQDVVVPQLRDFSLCVVAQAVEAILPIYGPLLGRRRCHGHYSTRKLNRSD